MRSKNVYGLRLISGKELLNITLEKMKLRYSFSSRQRLFALGICILVLFGQSKMFAQDRLVFRDGRTQDVKILGANGTSVQIQASGGSVSIPLALISTVTMAAPAELAAVNKAYEAGEYAKALPAAKALAEKYKGLPLEWAKQAASRVGDIQVALGNLQDAETSYKEFQKYYPGAGSVQTDIGLARIAIARKDFDSARQKLEPIAAEALKTKTPPAGKGAIYSQTFYLMGQLAEAEGKPSIALENYLRTVTIFSDDHGAVTAAQEKADALRKNNPNLTVP